MFRKTVKFQQVLELKNDGPKKSRAFRIHSNMSRQEMPNKLKKDNSFIIGRASRFQQNVQLAERDDKST